MVGFYRLRKKRRYRVYLIKKQGRGADLAATLPINIDIYRLKKRENRITLVSYFRLFDLFGEALFVYRKPSFLKK